MAPTDHEDATPVGPAPTGVDRLIAIQDITDVISAYCRHFDRNEPDEVAALFTADAVVDYGPDVPTTTSAAALRASMGAGLVEVFAATSHHVTNIEVSFLDGATASVESALFAWHRYRGPAPDGWLWGRYQHRMVATPAGWRISELTLLGAGAIDFHRDRTHPLGRR